MRIRRSRLVCSPALLWPSTRRQTDARGRRVVTPGRDIRHEEQPMLRYGNGEDGMEKVISAEKREMKMEM
eukprot:755317-Hanusia_phi.AAC.1